MSADPARLDEASARRVLLVRACETAPPGRMPGALWSPEDAAWATRLASETAGADAPDLAWLLARTRHACERLLPRSGPLALAAERGGWRPAWVLAAVLGGLVVGLAGDALGGRTLNLLAPPWLAVLGWNLLVYLFVLRQVLPRPRPAQAAGLRRALRAWMRARTLPRGAATLGPLAAFSADWAERSAALLAARAALLLHVAAAALAGGLVAGMYLRGLVFDLRAGWQSTFLEPQAVHALLGTLLTPASRASGIALPDAAGFAALRIGPEGGATTTAAPWIHLCAVTLALAVVVPRLLLALGATLAAARRARGFVIDLHEPYFQRLLTQARRARARLQVLPHGAAPAPAAVLGLRTLAARVFGDDVRLDFAPPLAYGDEEQAAAAPVPPGTTLRLALFDAAATPEPEAQGRFLAALQATPLPLLVLVDTTEFARRFATLPARRAERSNAWQALAAAHGLAALSLPLQEAPADAAAQAFEEALAQAPAAGHCA